MFIHSIRWRIQAWHGVLLFAVVICFGVTAWQLASTERLHAVDEELQALAAPLALLPPDAPQGRIPRAFVSNEGAVGHYFVVWRADGSVQTKSADAPGELEMPARPTASSETPHWARTRGTMRELVRFTVRPGRCFLIGRSIENELAAMRRLAWLLAGVGLGVIALGLGGGWWLATHALEPVNTMNATATRIAAGNLSERIDVAGMHNELGQLAGVLNSAFTRLEQALARQRQFSADASHELRTPLAIQIAETQTALARERTPQEYRETIEVCHDTAQQMRRLTESLLQLARLDDAPDAIAGTSVDLAVIAQRCCDLIQPHAAQRAVTIHCELAPAFVMGDDQRLGQVINNLLANAIEHSEVAGEVHLQTGVKDGQAMLVVSDTGVGISAKDLPHVFERFYRAEKSRVSAGEHTGLGLAIALAIVETHGGDIRATSQVGTGSRFTVRIPVVSIPHLYS